jgi:anti-sigma factor RsiW
MKLLDRDLVCQQAVELMTDYLEGALSWRQRRRLQRHLRDCAACTAYLAQLRISIATLGQVQPPPLADEIRADLIRLLHQYQDEPDPTEGP